MSSAWHPTAIVGFPPMHRDHRDRPFDWIPAIVDERARIEPYVMIEHGIYQPTLVGFAWLMPYVHIGHDAIVGDYVEIASGTVVAAHCVIGEGARLGIRTTMRPGIRIGEGARTGVGAVVVRDIPAGEVWVGNPARPLKPGEQLSQPEGVPHMVSG
jgi:acetyltransferase-like isoleucine patch superfamily enzyme